MDEQPCFSTKPSQNWITLLEFTIKPEEWSQVPISERSLIISLGHILNELNTVNRLVLTFQTEAHLLAGKRENNSEWQALSDANSTQLLFSMTIMAGKLCEVSKFLKYQLVNNDWFTWYREKLSEEGLNALELFLQDSPKNKSEADAHPLNIIRNLAASHYDPKFLAQVCSEENLRGSFTSYLARGNGNTLHWGSTMAVYMALFERIKPGNPVEASEIVAKLIPVLGNRFVSLLGELIGLAVARYFPTKFSELVHSRIRLSTVSDIDGVRFPFFTASHLDTPETQP